MDPIALPPLSKSARWNCYLRTGLPGTFAAVYVVSGHNIFNVQPKLVLTAFIALDNIYERFSVFVYILHHTAGSIPGTQGVTSLPLLIRP
jgi:hypothetical protein